MTEIALSPGRWTPEFGSNIKTFFDLQKEEYITLDGSLVQRFEAAIGTDYLEAESLQDRPALSELNGKNTLLFDSNAPNAMSFGTGFDLLNRSIFFALAPSLGGTTTIFSNKPAPNPDYVTLLSFLEQPEAKLRIRYFAQQGGDRYWSVEPADEEIIPVSANVIGVIGDPTNIKYVTNGVTDVGGLGDGVGYTFYDDLGARRAPAGNFVVGYDGHFGSIIITETLPTTDEVDIISGYLAYEFGATLNPGHPYETSPPVVADAESKLLTVRANNGIVIRGSDVTGAVKFVTVDKDGAEVPLLNDGQPVEYTSDFQDLVKLRYGSTVKVLHEGRSQFASISIDGVTEWS